MSVKSQNKIGTIAEYLSALTGSERFGPQVVHVREIAGQEAITAKPVKPWSVAMQGVVDKLDVEKLYSHQAEAIDLIRAGESVIVATPTASGKSLIYNLPVFEYLLDNPAHHALYLFPLKALAQDQLRGVESLNVLLPEKKRLLAEIYDGDTSSYRRRKIRDLLPHIMISNPDMLHLSLLGYHDRWGSYWSKLRYVIIDEVHTYRGVFGSHMAWVMRRLRRICAQYGNELQFILSSATVGNPQELAQDLLGCPVKVVTKSGAPQGKRIFAMMDPYDGPAFAASQLLEAALKRKLRTIVYTQSRKITELVSMWTSAKMGEDKDKLTAYRAGFLPEDRRDIEAKLTSGELLGVVSTSALELGIDIGALELCILVGYPGSIMATWQRSGRVGRRQHDSMVIMVAQEDALDKHFIRNPDDFFERSVEPAVLNPANRVIAKKHLLCAAAESPLAVGDPMLDGPEVHKGLAELVENGELLQSKDGKLWVTSRKYPHRQVDLRGSGNSFAIRLKYNDQLLGEIDGLRCLKECHPGAVYLQQGKTMLVDELDLDQCQVRVTQKDKLHYFTRAMSNKQTEIIEQYESKSMFNFTVSWGYLRVTDQVSEYQRRLIKGHNRIGTYPLDLPPSIFETEGLWLHIPVEIQHKMEEKQIHFMGGIHALEHAAIGVFPLLVLCDRNDVGGISIPYHHQVGGPAVFIYDGHAGGVGLNRQAYGKVEELLRAALTAIVDCSCETGCPSCVHSPKCGSGNRPIDKEAARILLDGMLSEDKVMANQILAVGNEPKSSFFASPKKQLRKIELPEHYAVFDLETKRSAAEVGGWHRAERMGISVGVVYDSKEDACFTYFEEQIDQLVEHLQQVELVVGFNNKRFDNQVLSVYTDVNLNNFPTLDVLEIVNNRLGYRLSLDRLAEQTLGVKKTADGLQALRWYKQGKMAEIADYCRQDVEITRDLLLFGAENEFLLFKNKAGMVVRCVFKS